jgi:hypothetical protein
MDLPEEFGQSGLGLALCFKTAFLFLFAGFSTVGNPLFVSLFQN